MRKRFLFGLFVSWSVLFAACATLEWEEFKPVALPYVIHDERPFKMGLSRARDGIHVSVFCRGQGDVVELEIITTRPHVTRTLRLEHSVPCNETEQQVLENVLFSNEDLVTRQNLDVSFDATVSQRGTMSLFGYGYTFRVDDAGKFYIEE